MSFTIRILGSNSALPTSKRFSSAHVLNLHERFFLIDCGEGTQIQLRKYKVNFSKINHIFISHLHGDHYYGLFGLISSFSLLGRLHDLHIYSHSDLLETIKCVFKKSKIDYKIIFHNLNFSVPEIIFENKNIVVKSFPLKHGIETCGFLFYEKQKELNIIKGKIKEYEISVKDILKIKKGENFTTKKGEVILNKYLTLPPYKTRSYAYCSDTMYFEKIIPTIKNTDLLYHEATFSLKDKKTAEKNGHSSSIDAAVIAKKANVGKLIIGHFSSRYKNPEILLLEQAKEIFENTFAVNDGDIFQIPQIRTK